MFRSNTCGELSIKDVGRKVSLSGWVLKSRDLGGMTFIDLRDRYGVTQLVFNMETNQELCNQARKLGREFVIMVTGVVAERSNKNQNMLTGDIEIVVENLTVLNSSETPPFTIEDETDGGDDLRMKYRYLDIRREPVKEKLILRHRMAQEVRTYFDKNGFIEVETPYLIKSTPEGARDFIVPSRMNQGQFYALPQSPQTFKQLLMVAGLDRYFQLVRCFRDEDLRADRQPEFTQIDCEMAFVEQEDVLEMFEGLIVHLLKKMRSIECSKPFPRLSYEQAISEYGTDKPDLRFEMRISDMTDRVKGQGFRVFDQSEYVGCIVAQGCSGYSRKEIDALTDFVTRPQVGAKGLVYIKLNEDGTIKSSVDKFFDSITLKKWATEINAKNGDLLLFIAGERDTSLFALSVLRLHLGDRLNLRDPNIFVPLWVVDFPLLDWDSEQERFHAMHHPFTSPKSEDLAKLDSEPEKVRANAYDMVINGVEVGGGSIRIHDRNIQEKMFEHLGFSKEQAQDQFGFLMNAFKYGAPPHGGIAFGFDRIVALFGGSESIRDYIAFPKNTSGRDVMINSPSVISEDQLEELNLRFRK